MKPQRRKVLWQQYCGFLSVSQAAAMATEMGQLCQDLVSWVGTLINTLCMEEALYVTGHIPFS